MNVVVNLFADATTFLCPRAMRAPFVSGLAMAPEMVYLVMHMLP